MRVKIFQKRQIRIRDFQVHQQRKKFLENRHNKDWKKAIKRKKAETSDEQRFQEKQLERI